MSALGQKQTYAVQHGRRFSQFDHRRRAPYGVAQGNDRWGKWHIKQRQRDVERGRITVSTLWPFESGTSNETTALIGKYTLLIGSRTSKRVWSLLSRWRFIVSVRVRPTMLGSAASKWLVVATWLGSRSTRTINELLCGFRDRSFEVLAVRALEGV